MEEVSHLKKRSAIYFPDPGLCFKVFSCTLVGKISKGAVSNMHADWFIQTASAEVAKRCLLLSTP